MLHTTSIPAFHNQDLLTMALTHRSSLNEHLSASAMSNERLEFLGDAVLELLTTQYLYDLLPDQPEGVLTAYRSALVKTTTLATVASELKLGEVIVMSKGEEVTGGRENPSLLADTLEAVIGALYLDQGLPIVAQFLHQHLFPKFAEIEQLKLYKDHKSLLQEVVQAKGLTTPIYAVVSESGPDHDKEFVAEVIISGKSYGRGMGKSKQQAHQAAAQQALSKFPDVV